MKFTRDQLAFIKTKFTSLTSREIFEHLVANFSFDRAYTSFRTECYNKGLYKCTMRRWTEAEKNFLLDNYKTMGNIEIAEKLSKSKRIFNKKQIEKQIKLLKLKRSPEDLVFIKDQHRKKGAYSVGNYKRWEDRKAKDGNKVVWICNNVPRVMIKVNESYKPYARYRYIQLHGPIAPGYKVYSKDCNPLNVEDDNLIIHKGTLDRAQRALYKRNISKYLLEQKSKTVPVPEQQTTMKSKPKNNMITVIINDKLRLQVKPGTDIEKLRKKYNSALNKNWEASNFQPMNVKI